MNSVTRITLAALIFLAAATNGYPAEDYVQPGEVSLPAEAFKATIGRVFGVEDQGGDIDYHVVELMNHSPATAGVRSALLPGWGQAFNDQGKKAKILGALFIASAGGSYLLYRSANQSYDDYIASGRYDNSNYDDYESQRAQSMVLGTVAVFLWGYSIYDAAANAYSPVTSQANTIDLAYLDRGAAVIWRRKFS